MFVQHYRHCSSCRCDYSLVGLHWCYDASRPPHVAAFFVGFSPLLGGGFDVGVVGGEGAVVGGGEVVVLGTLARRWCLLARRWYLHIGSVGWMSVVVVFFCGFVVLYVGGVGAEGVPILGIAVCRCGPPIRLHPLQCCTIGGYLRPCSV